jgi:metal-responsive CopG/Arc/MetJ family transcriptional regulator
LYKPIGKGAFVMGHGDLAQDKVRVCLVMPKDLKEELEKLSQAENRSMSNYIVTVLRDALSKAQDKSK